MNKRSEPTVKGSPISKMDGKHTKMQQGKTWQQSEAIHLFHINLLVKTQHRDAFCSSWSRASRLLDYAPPCHFARADCDTSETEHILKFHWKPEKHDVNKVGTIGNLNEQRHKVRITRVWQGWTQNKWHLFGCSTYRLGRWALKFSYFLLDELVTFSFQPCNFCFLWIPKAFGCV